jgi:hypothetical protein
MNSPTLNEISGYKEPTHLISVINDLEEKLKVTENLLSFFKKESNKNEELRKEFLRFVEHFKCFEKTSSDPSDAVAFKRAREVLNNS